jgi:hypothetical protein
MPAHATNKTTSRLSAARSPRSARTPPSRPTTAESVTLALVGTARVRHKPGRAEARPGCADDLRAPWRVEGVAEGGVLLPAVAYRCRIAGMAYGGGEPRPRRTGRRLRARGTRNDPDGGQRCDSQKRSYASSHENTPFLGIPASAAGPPYTRGDSRARRADLQDPRLRGLVGRGPGVEGPNRTPRPHQPTADPHGRRALSAWRMKEPFAEIFIA